MRGTLIVVAYVTAVPVGALVMLWLHLWLSLETHHFGFWDPRYLFLVHGTSAARLDLVEPISGSVRYAGRGQEGTAPHYVFIRFKTTVAPERVIEIYEARCREIGLATQRKRQDGQEPVLACEREGTEIGIRASRPDGVTDVELGGWEFE